jgi:tetratricopeptide (TPR) repeat protein
MIQEQYTSEEVQHILKDAYYQLGKCYFEKGADIDQAVSMLGKALQMDPDNIPVQYYLGQAIRIQVERDYLRRAADYLRSYLYKGAPLGKEDEVRQFLGTRR